MKVQKQIKQHNMKLGLSTLCFLIYLLFFLAILFLFTYYSQNYSQTLPKLIPKIVKNQMNILLQLNI